MTQMKNIGELNKLKVQLFIEAVLNQGRLELIDDLIAADYAGHIPRTEPDVTGPAGVRQLVSNHRRAHPGLHVKIEDQIAEEDRVATRWHATVPAPHAQDPLAPARRTAYYAGISITRLLAGKQVDSHTECTNLITNPAPAGKIAQGTSHNRNPCMAPQPHPRGQHLMRPKQKKERKVGAMFAPFIPALKRRARRIRLRRPAGCRIEPMPRMRWQT
jgi:predicted SnoaL-like aldol condensation-catalyzing enzyme